jgi:hypothetical protein
MAAKSFDNLFELVRTGSTENYAKGHFYVGPRKREKGDKFIFKEINLPPFLKSQAKCGESELVWVAGAFSGPHGRLAFFASRLHPTCGYMVVGI